MKKPKVIIAAGGTGGHIYPATAVAQDLQPDHEILFVGGALASNPFLDKSLFPYTEIPCGSMHLKHSLNILKGIWEGSRVIQTHKPDLIVGFGSYHTFPLLAAAVIRKIPIILHEANRAPGKVNRWFSRFAITTGLHFPDAHTYLKGNTVHVGMPLRKEYYERNHSLSDALSYFSLKPDRVTLLIFGGSQGAQGINQMMINLLKYSDIHLPFQVIHLTGNTGTTQTLNQLYQEKNIPCYVKDFESRMDLAWLITHLTIARSGAGTIAEMVEYGVPGVLIPYPYASDLHQDRNAGFLTDIGGAVTIPERLLDHHRLLAAIQRGIANAASMRESLRQYKAKCSATPLTSVIRGYLS